MVYLFFGQDDFSIAKELKEIKNSIASEELRDANTSILQGRTITISELSAACETIPFMANKRLVVVEGLLKSVEKRIPVKSSKSLDSGKGVISKSRLDGLVEYIPNIPDSTILVFLEKDLQKGNIIFTKLKEIVEVKHFMPLTGEQLRNWIKKEVSERGSYIEDITVQHLVDFVGNNLWNLYNEIEKLCLYVCSGVIKEDDVKSLVSPAREINIFAAIDAVIEGKPAKAINSLNWMLKSGSELGYIMYMLSRQIRLLILAKEAINNGMGQSAIGKRLGIYNFPLKKTIDKEKRFTLFQLKDMHGKLLDADLSIKTGNMTEKATLDVLVSQLCSK